MKRSGVFVLLLLLLISGSAVGCLPVGNGEQLVSLEADIRALSNSLAYTQQEIASLRKSLAETQVQTELLRRQLQEAPRPAISKPTVITVVTQPLSYYPYPYRYYYYRPFPCPPFPYYPFPYPPFPHP